MGEILGKPFVSESYDRLMKAQAKHRDASAALDAKPVDRDPWAVAIDLINAPVADLKAARGALGLSQAAMAEALGIDAPRLSKMENGGVIDRRTDLAVRCLLAMAAK